MSGLDKEQIVAIMKAAEDEIGNGFWTNEETPRRIWKFFDKTHLKLGCLPASFSALKNPELQKAYPDAKLVVGFTCNVDDDELVQTHIDGIHDFLAVKRYSRVHDIVYNYHAWIVLDGTNYLDITGPIYIENVDPQSYEYYCESSDHEVFKNFHPVLVGDQAEVFFNKMTEARTLNWFGDSQYVVPLEQESKSCLSKLLDKLKN
ncbi:TPA: hypothetical protein ACN32D_002140 [Vibrio parahaemolyticus]|uniref:Uncharacterized protein n=1 Tax=Vibrio panuliri TaxID=1381081 RepID=A0A1Q9HRR9_9VIBR|nr:MULTISPECIES: hypothetical protein [Vibrio]KIT46445.1 hypothetical protein H337_06920 [Vibrio parahaemolyticus EN9701121]EGQ7913855.1 hypothetical protein [Vibrio parahaemolyticus]EGQ9863339.1 hypothetical protein [Vibrio parahaemolyticus]EGW0142855.1 hypothetical protein [Vibrio parahaemolyticus]EHB9909300.1 hypothetical protein [Vibrio parahaemolyticus]